MIKLARFIVLGSIIGIIFLNLSFFSSKKEIYFNYQKIFKKYSETVLHISVKDIMNISFLKELVSSFLKEDNVFKIDFNKVKNATVLVENISIYDFINNVIPSWMYGSASQVDKEKYKHAIYIELDYNNQEFLGILKTLSPKNYLSELNVKENVKIDGQRVYGYRFRKNNFIPYDSIIALNNGIVLVRSYDVDLGIEDKSKDAKNNKIIKKENPKFKDTNFKEKIDTIYENLEKTKPHVWLLKTDTSEIRKWIDFSPYKSIIPFDREILNSLDVLLLKVVFRKGISKQDEEITSKNIGIIEKEKHVEVLIDLYLTDSEDKYYNLLKALKSFFEIGIQAKYQIIPNIDFKIDLKKNEVQKIISIGVKISQSKLEKLFFMDVDKKKSGKKEKSRSGKK